jgi:hypothetical protein
MSTEPEGPRVLVIVTSPCKAAALALAETVVLIERYVSRAPVPAVTGGDVLLRSCWYIRCCSCRREERSPIVQGVRVPVAGAAAAAASSRMDSGRVCDARSAEDGRTCSLYQALAVTLCGLLRL